MSEILGNIYDRSVAIVFGTVFFSSFWKLSKLVFLRKIFQNLIFFSFYPKNGRTGSRKSCPTPHWVTFLIFFRLVYDIPSHLNGLILA